MTISLIILRRSASVSGHAQLWHFIPPSRKNQHIGKIKVIPTLVGYMARRNFSRVMRFQEGKAPCLPPARSGEPRLLYLHIPFCERLCPYCSFNRFVFEERRCREYFSALRREILLYKKNGYDFGGVYVGGGTPTILMDQLEETLDLVRRCFSIREVSVETNPNHLVPDKLERLCQAGVNRLSVGIQSFDDGLLKAMDRYDKYGSGAEITDRLRQAQGRFDTLNADMIFNFPSQEMAMLDRDLDILLDLGVDQVTWYPLMVSDSTRQSVMRTLGRVDKGREKAFYERIRERLKAEYRFSSAWCFSRKGAMIDEYIVDYDEYAGLGSGSIGYLDGVCYANTFDIAEYCERLNRDELPLMAARTFSPEERMRYDFVMKFFGTKLNLESLRAKYGGRLSSKLWLDFFLFRLAGALHYSSPDWRLTQRGCYLWVVIMREFFTAVNNFRDFCRADISLS
ncbi:MAG: Oxygen-independent coproporphyrinogen-III oxidase 1 [Syntrophus sp. PtaB.Bin001]|nr:MAG: Oxygen-independent coproporphyrinogen-III oxidase 1 [Syntrophus sp. PtaB.Bin001]